MSVTFQSNLPQVLKALDAAAKDRLTDVARMYQKEIRATLTGARSGRHYKTKRAKRGEHVASAPGESPANLTRSLSRSIRYRVIGGGLQDLKAIVGSRSFKAPMLEYGTGEAGLASMGEEAAPSGYRHGGGKAKGKRAIRKGPGIARRPFMKKAFLKGREEAGNILRTRWDLK